MINNGLGRGGYIIVRLSKLSFIRELIKPFFSGALN